MHKVHINTHIKNHYTKTLLFEEILERLKQQGIDPDIITRNDLNGVDEFHVRGAEVSREIAKEINLDGSQVLDVGCGIGGPARMLADEFNCEVTGIDMSHEFILTARKLSALVGLRDKTEFIQGDALELPFENGTFDVAWTQHVQMNVNDKARFYSEIARVLSDKGIFIYYDVFRKGKDDLDYPVPWANDPSISFLGTILNMDTILTNLGLKKVQATDQTENALTFFSAMFEKNNKNGNQNLGQDVFMGASSPEKFGNLLKGLKEHKIVLQSGIYRKK
ncbi:MAG: methyltransferase domain-containing protein [Bacteroidales bacterium]|nr:methyltransferase domain-containing protein [Bacteroidales bacterium]